MHTVVTPERLAQCAREAGKSLGVGVLELDAMTGAERDALADAVREMAGQAAEVLGMLGADQAGACTAPAEYVVLLNSDEDTAERVCGGHLADQLRELLQGRPGEWTVTELNPGAGFACEHGEDGCE